MQLMQKLSVFQHAVQNIDHIATVYMIPFPSCESTPVYPKSTSRCMQYTHGGFLHWESAQHAASCDPIHDFLVNRGSTTAYQAITYEYAIEMTHPLPEGTAAGLLNFVGMVSYLSQMALHPIISPIPSSKYV